MNQEAEIRSVVIDMLEVHGIKIMETSDMETHQKNSSKKISGKIFGRQLDDLKLAKVQIGTDLVVVPKIIKLLVEKVEAAASRNVRVYLETGNEITQDKVMDELDELDDIDADVDKILNNLGGIDSGMLLKKLLRKLPLPLIPTGYIRTAMFQLVAGKSYDEVERPLCLVSLLIRPLHLMVLRYILGHLSTVLKMNVGLSLPGLCLGWRSAICPIDGHDPKQVLRGRAHTLLEGLIMSASVIGIVPQDVQDILEKASITEASEAVTSEDESENKNSDSLKCASEQSCRLPEV